MNQKFIKSIIPFLISLICMYLFYKEASFNLFFNELKKVNYLYIIVASLLLYLTVWLRSIRWKMLLNIDCSVYSLFKIQMIGYFANNILPLRVGEILRSFLLGKNQNISKSYVLGTVVIERFLDMIMLLFMAIICIFISPLSNIGGISIYSLLFIILGIILAFLLIFISISSRIIKIKLIENFLNKFISSYRKLNFHQFLYMSLFGVLIWLIYWLNVYLVFKAFNSSVLPYQSLIILIVASIINSVPSLPGSIGTFHFGIELILRAFNMEDNFIYTFTTILHLYGYILLTLIGLYYFIIDSNIGIKQLINLNKK